MEKEGEGDRKRGGGLSGRAAERDREGEGGEESGRGREKGGVIVGGRGGDSLVDGQKDKGKREESERDLSEGWLGMKKLTDALR